MFLNRELVSDIALVVKEIEVWIPNRNAMKYAMIWKGPTYMGGFWFSSLKE